jgi:aminoglycoside 3-N-acetyltransferase
LKNFNEKRSAASRHLKEKIRRPIDRLFLRISGDALSDAFHRIGVTGSTISVHSSLGRLGFVLGGPSTLIQSLIDSVGPNGSIMMPTFPIKLSMYEHLQEMKPFDFQNDPSQNGIVTEIFRRRPDVVRSLHPTNPVAVRGDRAEELIVDHEKSDTPFGFDTPYGRLANMQDGYILMLETHIHSFLHHLQERVRFPNLFLSSSQEAYYFDRRGNKGTLVTKVLRSRIPYYVAIPSKRRADPDWVLLHDFALMFPSRRKNEVHQAGYRFDGYRRIEDRATILEKAGILRTARIGRGQIGLLHVKSYMEHIEPELAELIEKFRLHYEPSRIAALNLPYF